MFTLDIIISLLDKQNKSQKELCAYLGISKQAFTNWKNGNNTSYLKYLAQLADYFNVSTDYLLGRTTSNSDDDNEEMFIMSKIDNLFIRMNELKITAKQLSENTGISTGNISDWKSGRSLPTALKLDVLADYLNCSTDYLLGRTSEPQTTPIIQQDLPKEQLLNDYNELNGEGKEKIRDYANDLVSSGKYKKHSQYRMAEEKNA